MNPIPGNIRLLKIPILLFSVDIISLICACSLDAPDTNPVCPAHPADISYGLTYSEVQESDVRYCLVEGNCMDEWHFYADSIIIYEALYSPKRQRAGEMVLESLQVLDVFRWRVRIFNKDRYIFIGYSEFDDSSYRAKNDKVDTFFYYQTTSWDEFNGDRKIYDFCIMRDLFFSHYCPENDTLYFGEFDVGYAHFWNGILYPLTTVPPLELRWP